MTKKVINVESNKECNAGGSKQAGRKEGKQELACY